MAVWLSRDGNYSRSFQVDSESKLILYTNADIRRGESDDLVTRFLSFYNAVHRGVKPTLVFDSKLNFS